MFFGATFFPPAVMMVLLPPRDPEEALVDLTQVAGVEPPVDEGGVGCLGILVVAEEHVAAPYQDLAVLGDLHLDTRVNRPHRGELDLPRHADRRRTGVLGLPVDLVDRDPEPCEELEQLL